MATKTICYPVVRGEVARFTRLDDCGKPLYGACSVIVTDAITELKASAQLEEGEEISEKNMAGAICIADKPCDALKWYEIEITLCKVFPALFNLVAGYRNTIGPDSKVNGYAIGQNINCSGGFALEIWGTIPGVGCGDSAASGQWDYLLFPWVSAATLSGDIEVGNAARKPVLKGRTKLGNGWGSGPFKVDVDPETGLPINLFDPILSSEHVADQVVHLKPPVADCACEALSSPNGPAVTAAKDSSDATGMTVKLTTSATPGPFKVDWGDGSAISDLPTGATGVTHMFTDASCTASARCEKTIRVWDPAKPNDPTFVTVLVPFP